MILNGANSDDYLYFKIETQQDYYPSYYRELKPGTIIRFNVKDLASSLWRRYVVEDNDDIDFEFIKKENPSKFAYLPQDLYEKIIVKKNMRLRIDMQYGDLLVLNNWLWNRLTDDTRPSYEGNELSYLFGTDNCKSAHMLNYEILQHTPMITADGSEIAGSEIFKFNEAKAISTSSIKALANGIYHYDEKTDEIIAAYKFCSDAPLYLELREGDELNFRSAITAITFLRQDMLRFLLEITPLSEEEKMVHFFRDFDCWIPEANRRYFRLRDEIKIKEFEDFLLKSEVWEAIKSISSDFCNMFAHDFYRCSREDNFDRDENGFIRYVWCGDEPLEELELSKIATRISDEEGRKHYAHELEAKKKNLELFYLKCDAITYIKNHKSRYKKARTLNPDISEIDFYHEELRKEKEIKKALVRKLTRVLNKRIEDINKNA